MNNNIDEQLVSFETAKLLKEKGFDVITDMIYITNHTSEILFENINGLKHSDGNNPFISAPTQQLAIDWIYKNYNIWIITTPFLYSKNVTHWRWGYVSTKYKTRGIKWEKEKDYMSPEEAKEAAIIYVLKEILIKTK
jgi:hypothetical protein